MEYLQEYLHGICFGGGFITVAILIKKIFGEGLF